MKTIWPNQALEPSAGRRTERLKDEVKTELALASGG
jgi:hypothetical protein